MEPTTTKICTLVQHVQLRWMTLLESTTLLGMGKHFNNLIVSCLKCSDLTSNTLDPILRPLHLLHSTVFDDFDDFFITSIAGDSQTDTEFWVRKLLDQIQFWLYSTILLQGILLNFVFTPVGGCQQQVKHNDHVLWAFNAFNVTAFLKLEGPHSARLDTPVTFTVTDGQTGNPIEGADVNGVTSDEDGHVVLSFDKPEIVALKAEKMGTIRSNAVRLVIT
jgi:hypothetical protein